MEELHDVVFEESAYMNYHHLVGVGVASAGYSDGFGPTMSLQCLVTVSLLCIQMVAERPSMEREVAMLQGDNGAVVLQPGNVEQGLKGVRLMAFGESWLGTVRGTEGKSLLCVYK